MMMHHSVDTKMQPAAASIVWAALVYHVFMRLLVLIRPGRRLPVGHAAKITKLKTWT